MTLTVIQARNAAPKDRDYKLFDSHGLFLLVTKAGTRSWRFKYRYGRKEKLLTFGHFPEVTLAAARDQRDKARAILREGKDPAIEARKLKHALIAAANTTFKSVAEAWFEDELPGWSISHEAEGTSHSLVSLRLVVASCADDPILDPSSTVADSDGRCDAAEGER